MLILAAKCKVAVDETDQKISILAWEPKTVNDKKQHKAALKLAEMRKQVSEEMQLFVE